MTTTDYEYDPERALWKPNRRFFLFGLAAGILAPVLPSPPLGLRDLVVNGATIHGYTQAPSASAMLYVGQRLSAPWIPTQKRVYEAVAASIRNLEARDLVLLNIR